MQRINVVLEDDKDGGPADQTITFSLGRKVWEIDLNDKNAHQMELDILRWADLGRQIAGAGRTRRVGAPKRKSDGEAAKIRAWAAEQGIAAPARGRVPQEIKTAYYAGHSD